MIPFLTEILQFAAAGLVLAAAMPLFKKNCEDDISHLFACVMGENQ